jgi:hypothetical protein
MSRSALAALAAVAVVLTTTALHPGPAPARTGPVQLGAAVNSTGFAVDLDPRYRATLGMYDAVTAESAMKIGDLQP